jgi:phytoene desaturase
VQFRFGTTVGSIEIDAGRARAVITTAGERIRADAVVVNADLPTAYRELIPAEYRPRRVDRLRYSPSCVLMHAGTTSAPDGGRHHTIEFGHSWSSTFAELGNGRLMSDPSALIGRPTLTDPTMAPPGGHAWYVLLPAPNLVDGADIDWSTLGPRYQEEILAWLATRGYRELGADVEVSRWVTPADWAAVGLAAGAPFSARHSLGQTGPFRLPTLDRRVENLVFCGANTQPGVGVPMVLLSGRLAAERIVGATR